MNEERLAFRGASTDAVGVAWSVTLPLGTLLVACSTVWPTRLLVMGGAGIGALIGAGGFGQPILTGIRLDDLSLILQGAVPAALLALLVQGLFELAERTLAPKGLRLKPE